MDALSNPDDLPGAGRKDEGWITRPLTMALEVGATPPLEYVGEGATSVVLCDARYAYKVAKHARLAAMTLADEAEWLQTASQIPAVRKYVAKFQAWDPARGVIVRECVRGRVGNDWRDGEKLTLAWDAMAPHMLATGWGMPEFKGSSFVMENDSKPKLVDAGFVNRLSNRLIAYVEDVLDGRRERDKYEDDSTFAFYIRRELGAKEKLDEARASKLLDRLYTLGARR